MEDSPANPRRRGRPSSSVGCGGTARGRTTITPAAVPFPRLGAVRESTTTGWRGTGVLLGSDTPVRCVLPDSGARRGRLPHARRRVAHGWRRGGCRGRNSRLPRRASDPRDPPLGTCPASKRLKRSPPRGPLRTGSTRNPSPPTTSIRRPIVVTRSSTAPVCGPNYLVACEPRKLSSGRLTHPVRSSASGS